MENPSLRRVHKTLIAPVMNYATAGWQPWLSKSKMDELERAQNRALRTITGQTRTAPTEALQAEAGIQNHQSPVVCSGMPKAKTNACRSSSKNRIGGKCQTPAASIELEKTSQQIIDDLPVGSPYELH